MTTAIVDDFSSLSVELSRIEQAKMPTVQPDFSATDSGDVAEARKTYYGLYGYPTGGGIDALSTADADAGC